MGITVSINYLGPNGRPVSVATVADKEFLVIAACRAIEEAEERAHNCADRRLSLIHMAEAERLRKVFEAMMPGAIAAMAQAMNIENASVLPN